MALQAGVTGIVPIAKLFSLESEWNLHLSADALTKHKMNSEQVIIGKEACDIVNSTKLAGHRVCSVGVSTARATETAVGTDGLLKAPSLTASATAAWTSTAASIWRQTSPPAS